MKVEKVNSWGRNTEVLSGVMGIVDKMAMGRLN